MHNIQCRTALTEIWFVFKVHSCVLGSYGQGHPEADINACVPTSIYTSFREWISARDLGIIINRELSLESHVTAVCRAGYNQLSQLRSVVHSLSVHATKTLVQAFISCRLDYCNSLFYGINDGLLRRLQSVQKQNATARLVTGAGRRDHITPVLRRLHWLPVRQRVVFTVAGLVQPVTGGSRACVPHRRLPSTVWRRPTPTPVEF